MAIFRALVAVALSCCVDHGATTIASMASIAASEDCGPSLFLIQQGAEVLQRGLAEDSSSLELAVGGGGRDAVSLQQTGASRKPVGVDLEKRRKIWAARHPKKAAAAAKRAAAQAAADARRSTDPIALLSAAHARVKARLDAGEAGKHEHHYRKIAQLHETVQKSAFMKDVFKAAYAEVKRRKA
mmetsp:Transcript_117324/g.331985  ORF Transcript_117324/g.331985 Transcript_117324/m.331985 type:complete len:184 (-) Transcript_117324:75-626(-)